MNAFPHIFASDAAGKPHSGTRQHCESLQVALIREGKHPYLVPMGAGAYQIGLARNQKEAQKAGNFCAAKAAAKLSHRGLRSTILTTPGAC